MYPPSYSVMISENRVGGILDERALKFEPASPHLGWLGGGVRGTRKAPCGVRGGGGTGTHTAGPCYHGWHPAAITNQLNCALTQGC